MEHKVNLPKCRGCGKCCIGYTVQLTSDEVKKFDNKYIRCDDTGVFWLKQNMKNGRKYCIFLDVEKNICMIYNNRPVKCREFLRGGDRCLNLINI